MIPPETEHPREERIVSWTPQLPDRENVREDERAAYDRVVGQQTAYGYVDFVKRFHHKGVLDAFPGDRVQPYFAAMLNSPLISAGMSDLGVVYRTRGEFDDGMSHADREWIDMVICDELGNNWVLYVHAPDAAAVGVRAEAILALIDKRYDDLTSEEREKELFIRAVINGTMEEKQYKSMEQLVGVRGAVEIVCFTAHLIKTLRIMRAFGIPDVTHEELREWVQALVDGKVELPDHHARVPVAAAAAEES
jgi:alkylhydroperoxidase/carboxymuconolactone decarboxylase family protein YurZ